MRIPTSITIVCLFTLSAAGCVAPSDEPAQDVATAAADIDATPSLPCPDVHADLPGPAPNCGLPDGTWGRRQCTDHDTFHYAPRFGPPPDFQITCMETSIDVRTTCGGCQSILVP